MAVPRRKLDLKKPLFLLPTMITLSSIFCGFDSIRLSGGATSDDDFYRASLLLVFALFFDMLDGRVARLTKTQSAFGLQIDSLADVVSFAVAPAILVYNWSLHQKGTLGLVRLLFAGAGAVRLARFNVLSMGEGGEPSQPGTYIVGLPVPGAAGILISLVVANHAVTGPLSDEKYVWAMMALTLFLAFLMVSTIKFRSFKDLRLNARSVALVAFAVGSSAVVSLRYKPAFVLIWLLSFYVAIGLFEMILSLPRRRRERRSVPPSRAFPRGNAPGRGRIHSLRGRVGCQRRPGTPGPTWRRASRRSRSRFGSAACLTLGDAEIVGPAGAPRGGGPAPRRPRRRWRWRAGAHLRFGRRDHMSSRRASARRRSSARAPLEPPRRAARLGRHARPGRRHARLADGRPARDVPDRVLHRGRGGFARRRFRRGLLRQPGGEPGPPARGRDLLRHDRDGLEHARRIGPVTHSPRSSGIRERRRASCRTRRVLS